MGQDFDDCGPCKRLPQARLLSQRAWTKICSVSAAGPTFQALEVDVGVERLHLRAADGALAHDVRQRLALAHRVDAVVWDR